MSFTCLDAIVSVPKLSTRSWFSPVVSFLTGAVVKLSKVDGKAGLSPDDFRIVVAKAKELASDTTNKAVKAQQLAAYIRRAFGVHLPNAENWGWVPDVIGWAAVQIAKRLKLIP